MSKSLEFRGIKNLSEFQRDSSSTIVETLKSFLSGEDPKKVFILNAPTAGGKTEAFLIPVLGYVWLEKVIKEKIGTKALIFYPTKALADDQFQRLAFYVSVLNEERNSSMISLGIFHGDIRPRRSSCLYPTCKGRLGIRLNDEKIEIFCTECHRTYSPNQIAPPKGKCPWCYEGFCPKCNSKLETVYECSEHGIVKPKEDNSCQVCNQHLSISKTHMKCVKHGNIDLSNLKLISVLHTKKTEPKSMHDCDFVLKHELCGREYPFIAYLRNQIFDNLPDIVITNPDIVHKYMTSVPGRKEEPFDRYEYYDYQRIYRLLGKKCYYCESCDWTFDSASETCPLKTCQKKGQKAHLRVSHLGFLIIDEIHMMRGNFGCNTTGFFSNLIEVISSLSGIKPICISATATVKNVKHPPASIFGFNIDSVVVLSPEMSTTDTVHERLHLFILPKGYNTISTLREVLTALYVHPTSIDTFPRLLRDDRSTLQTLVFFDNKRNLYETASTLHPATIGGAEIDVHTADVSREKRRKIEEEFTIGRLNILLATSTLEVGVDFDFLNLLINVGVPYSYNSYLQRVGRAGRRGSALIVNILRYQVPLDNYYFENFRELISYMKENVDIVPIARDIPLSVRRHVFVKAAILGVLTHTTDSARTFYSLNLENDDAFRKFLSQVEKTFLKPPMTREHELKLELQNACEFLRYKMSEISDGMRLNDALNAIARSDPTNRLDFSLRKNEIEVPISIETSRKFRQSLRGSLSDREEDLDAIEHDSEESQVSE